MRRIELIKTHLSNIVDNCNSEQIHKLLLDFQHVDVMYGYAVASLLAFEDKMIGNSSDEEVANLMDNGEYYRRFDTWLNEEV